VIALPVGGVRVMRDDDDLEYFEQRAAEELDAARSAADHSARALHLKVAKCSHYLARGIAERERILAHAIPPGSLQ
jgi:hypothetical protein